MTTLQLRGLTKAYSAFKAVDDLSLTLRDGEFLSLLGPSGCGKTTTLRMIAGFITPTAGTILLDGEEISSPSGVVPPERRQMSMIFQSYAIWPNMTVAQNVGFGLRKSRARRPRCCASCSSTTSPGAIRRNSRAASSSAWRLPVPSRSSPR